MAAKGATPNPLVISGKPDTSLSVQLHPLVLLTISDYITRHTLRQQNGPIVGAVIGQQNGRSFTLEHAFECKVSAQDGEVKLDQEWFSDRIEMYKDVHKAPALELVALFALGPVDGPQPAHLPMLRQVRQLLSSDSIMLLLFHPEMVDSLQGGKLPISLFESVEEIEADQLQLRFRELQYEVETGDAEMIGVDFVAKGGGTATAVRKAEIHSPTASGLKEKKGKGKGKAKEEDGDTNETTSTHHLSAEDDELISSLNAKVNAIKMLNERLDLIRSYLTSLPPSYLTDSTLKDMPENANYTLLRSVNSMLSRLPLLTSPKSDSQAASNVDGAASLSSLQQAEQKEKQDVHLTSLLANLTRSVAEAQSLSSKFHVVQRERANKDRAPFGRNGRMGAGDENTLMEGGGNGGF
ncbi:unnamed protein product [Zymoseptoria tritici ST99CH_1E4]|uniref:COP9 signalosome complex subunit 6 n=1 Tax=Zymoseptoria tritici ST99CH_1E4 TaxID=1276532 RepID=A0A2H1G595_ZYMTR|nr:unnamed protein product [Zymoseptoria tritici ST99CH_1E4]